MDPGLQFQTLEDLSQALMQAGVDPSSWNNLEELHQEIQHGDCQIHPNSNYGLLRYMEIVVVMIRHDNLLLVEKQQAHKETGEARSRKLVGSLIEKLMQGEDPLQGAARVLGEEMDISGALQLSPLLQGDHFLQSRSYPGLWTHYHIFYTECPMPPGLYKPSYQVEYDQWTTTWEWVPASSQSEYFLPL